jgi:hypothetical protein
VAVNATVSGAEPRSGVAVVAHAARAAEGSQKATADAESRTKPMASGRRTRGTLVTAPAPAAKNFLSA